MEETLSLPPPAPASPKESYVRTRKNTISSTGTVDPSSPVAPLARSRPRPRSPLLPGQQLAAGVRGTCARASFPRRGCWGGSWRPSWVRKGTASEEVSRRGRADRKREIVARRRCSRRGMSGNRGAACGRSRSPRTPADRPHSSLCGLPCPRREHLDRLLLVLLVSWQWCRWRAAWP